MTTTSASVGQASAPGVPVVSCAAGEPLAEVKGGVGEAAGEPIAGGVGGDGGGVGGGGGGGSPHRRTFMDRADAFVSRLSARSTFWHRICSLFWLPYAFRSGIRMKRVDEQTFAAVLPFKRFNRNWYNAMAGAALLGNSEIAGGMYVFGICGGDYTVVCKNLEYRFLRPCYGPALYRITPREDIKSLADRGAEFNIVIDLEVVQQIGKKEGRDRRVGRCTATFHCTPKSHQIRKGRQVR